MSLQIITSLVHLIGGIFLLTKKKKYPKPMSLLDSIFINYIGVGFICVGLWNLFIINYDNPIVTWLNNNVMYLNFVVMGIFLIIYIIQHALKKK
jgi:TRAP-type C4-dicarboxylate transport system permease small subunit